MPSTERRTPELLNAVVGWFRFYSVPFDEDVANVLCDRALDLFNDGVTGREISTRLIREFVGAIATKVNAPTSNAIH